TLPHKKHRAPRGFLRLLFVLFARENIDAEGVYHQKAAPLGVKKPRKLGFFTVYLFHLKLISIFVKNEKL
ncbi:MAG: hypothetical protein II034_04635, partial [Muribaculaceae bacterium]|nr:hypothetical protein [Muribaculaceae bacterium]